MSEMRTDRESMNVDVLIVGAGPAGLSAAIRLKQLNPKIHVCVLEKGSEVGAHLISGAVFEPRALDELIPDWKERGAPITVEAKKDSFLYLTKDKAIPLPTPPQMHNKGNYIISLSQFGRWLAQQAESLGVEIYAGFAGAEILYHANGSVKGVATGDMGIGKNGEKTDMFQPGMELHAKQTIFAEGCHGSLTKQLIERFRLRDGISPQTYALGIKEIWEIDPAKHQEGTITHTVGWPMDSQTYGGSFIYHWSDRRILIGFVTALDYQNPYMSPFEEMQRFKTHPSVKPLLEGGKRIAYGARALVEGGLQSLPKLTFPGGMLAGDCAGFLNVPKIKGNHCAMKTGMLAAEAIARAFQRNVVEDGLELTQYTDKFKSSWVYKELYKVRNIRPGFHKGFWFGMIHAAFQTLGGWMLPYTLKNHADYAQMKQGTEAIKIDYPKPDGILTFDRLSSVFLTDTAHEEDQPSHLILKDPDIPTKVNLSQFAGPSQRYCPAAVYEFVNGQFIINAQNCIHCKTCDIKDPSQNITWTVPQGGSGPNYSMM